MKFFIPKIVAMSKYLLITYCCKIAGAEPKYGKKMLKKLKLFHVGHYAAHLFLFHFEYVMGAWKFLVWLVTLERDSVIKIGEQPRESIARACHIVYITYLNFFSKSATSR